MEDSPKTMNVQRMTALNAVVLTGCTLVGILSNISSHLLGSKSSVLIALAAWLIAFGLALYFSGKAVSGAQSLGLGATLLAGLRAAKTDKVFSVILLVLSVGAVYSAYNANKAVSLQQVHEVSLQTKEDTGHIIQKLEQEVPPAQALSQMGYSMAQADVCRAIADGNKQALSLMTKLSSQPIKLSKAEGEGQYSFCLEELLISGGANSSMLNKSEGLAIDHTDLGRLYAAEGIGPDAPGRIDIQVIAKQAGASGARAQLLEVKATPMMLAVWGANSVAVSALIAQGVDVNTASKLMTATYSKTSAMPALYDISVSPLAEAKRLQLADITQALTQAGAQVISQSKSQTR